MPLLRISDFTSRDSPISRGEKSKISISIVTLQLQSSQVGTQKSDLLTVSLLLASALSVSALPGSLLSAEEKFVPSGQRASSYSERGVEALSLFLAQDKLANGV